MDRQHDRNGQHREQQRRTANARKIWTIVALIACALSLGSPLISGIGTGAKLGLASLHLVVGAVLIPGLRRTATGRRRGGQLSRAAR